VKHFGIWNIEHKAWMRSDGGMILWSTSKTVMDAELASWKVKDQTLYMVREFIDNSPAGPEQR
jgi:hypothetical protein